MSYFTRIVWLARCSARVAHQIDGATSTNRWATRCGRDIQRVVERGGHTEVREYGSLIEWRLLNHDLVSPCRSCARGQ